MIRFDYKNPYKVDFIRINIYFCKPRLAKREFMDNTISEKLRKIRKYRGLSLDSVCEKIGFIVSKQALFKYEKGLMNPSKPVLDAILKVYGNELRQLRQF